MSGEDFFTCGSRRVSADAKDNNYIAGDIVIRHYV